MRRNRTFLGPQGMGMVSLWGASSLIQSVQQIIWTINASPINTTITAVDTTRSIILPHSAMSYSGSNNTNVGTVGALSFTSTTNVRCTRNDSSGAVPDFAAASVIEFAPGVIKSIQSATTACSAATTTTTINAVNTAKTLLIVTVQYAGGVAYKVSPKVLLATSTTVTQQIDTFDAGFVSTVGLQVVEFF